MSLEYAVIELPGNGNYAITLPGQITFITDATETEFIDVREETINQYVQEEDKETALRASLAIIPTFDCNLGCIYCYARGGESKETVKLEFVETALDYERSKNPTSDWIDLYLVGGGEPLLYFDLVKKIVKLARNYFEKVQIHVVTNGTFNKEVRDWLIREKADLRISYDGVSHDSQRPYSNGAFSSLDIENTIRELVKANNRPIVQMIVTSNSLCNLKESALKIVELGINVVKIEPALTSEISRGQKSLEPNPKQYANKLLDLIDYIVQEDLPLKVDTGFFAKPAIGYYCGMANGNFTLTPNGLITPCVEVARDGDPYMQRLTIGSVRSAYEVNKENKEWLKNLHYRNQIGGCGGCNLRMMCLGGCPMANIWKNGLPLRKSSYTCTIEHFFLPKLLLMMAKDYKIMEIVMENTILV